MEPLDFTSARELTAERFHACMRPSDSDRATVDLSALNWTDPAGLVGLASFIEGQSRLGRAPVVLGPRIKRRSQFLHRMGLDHLISRFDGEHDLIPSTVWDQTGYLLELQRFDGSNTGGLAVIVRQQLPDGPVATAVHKGISEIGTNSLDHSDSGHGYIAVLTKPESRLVQFAVSDAGIGMLEPLRGQGFMSHAEVLQAVLDGGVSRLEAAGRGRGIKRTREVVTRAGGEVFLASGSATIRAWAHGDRPMRNTRTHPQVITGTLFQASMHTV